MPNDPEYQALWGLKNSGQVVQSTKGEESVDIGAEKAWDLTTGSPTLVVAVVDTGVDHKNAELKENMWVNAKESAGRPGIDDDMNGYVDDVFGYDFFNEDGDPRDDHGHGTHVAGTIGAAGDNRSGVAGVSWKVRLMGVKFLGSGGSGSTEDAIRAIQYAIDNGAKVINASWGGGDYSKALEDVLKKAQDKGVLFVAAAGNSGRNTDMTPAYPACYRLDNVISVASVTNKGSLSYFSNYGRKSVHLAAPGSDILSLGLNGLEYQSGTSMAAPHVSGVAALLLSREPNLSPVQVRNRLVATTKSLNDLRGKTVSGGLVNAFFALTNQHDPNDPQRWPAVNFAVSSPSPYPNDANLKFEVRAPAGTKAFSIHFARIETEETYDVVKVFDAKGGLIWKGSGSHEGLYSPVIEGSEATIVLTSDNGNQKQGFEVDRLALRP
ncbi:MAG TPA: S8 family serine peptidase [Bdellovibrionales bacterium]|nr:S8 family serine peptidase [Bdellovibrionales bacterium]